MNKLHVLAFLLFAARPLHADVYRCQLADKTLYQDTPCPEKTLSQRALAIEKTSPEATAEAQRRLETWESDFADREAAERAAKKNATRN